MNRIIRDITSLMRKWCKRNQIRAITGVAKKSHQMRPVRWRKGALVLAFLLMASMSYMIFSSIRNRHETVLLGAAESHTTETARTLANKANEAPGRSTRTQFPPRPTPHRGKEPPKRLSIKPGKKRRNRKRILETKP